MRVKIFTLKFINGVKGDWSENKHVSWNFCWSNFGQNGLVLASQQLSSKVKEMHVLVFKI